ncbi:hypothetical protein OF83DRAFT_1173640 [Amylostereum chailletii]|nr:hypothetical protein OF83DRAFT_1173640 [Amylostereum chailletii]
MVYWRGTNALLNDYGGVVKVIHATCGIVLWETLSTLTYEWTIFSKKRPYRWTIWIHLICRLSCLLSFIFIAAHDDTTVKSACQSYSTVFLVCAYLSVALGSFLVILRVIAVWERNILVSAFSVLLWLTSIALNFREPFIVTSSWNTYVNACNLVFGDTLLVNVPMMVTSDILLLLLVLAGLVRKPEARGQGIFRFLHYQGIVWLLVAMLAGVPTLVLVALNLNDPLNLTLQPIALASLSICSTRMYRSLGDYGSVSVYRAEPEVSNPPRFRRFNTTTLTTAADVENNASSVLDITEHTA